MTQSYFDMIAGNVVAGVIEVGSLVGIALAVAWVKRRFGSKRPGKAGKL